MWLGEEWEYNKENYNTTDMEYLALDDLLVGLPVYYANAKLEDIGDDKDLAIFM